MSSKILVVDDSTENRMLLASIVRDNTNYEVISASNGIDVIELIDKFEIEMPDLILLDIMMPDMNGFQVAEILKSNQKTMNIPIIFITALTEEENIVNAFEKGGVDYISKPFRKQELLSRVNVHMKLKNIYDEMKVKNIMLEDKEFHLNYLVEKKTKKIELLTFAMVSALENASLLNDTDTGFHIKRVSKYSAIIAEAYGCDNEFIKQIEIYSSLHDVGKVGIPDYILKKPGKYTDNEFEKMKEHVLIGAKMLDNPEISEMAKNITKYHHERWDGTGYKSGLKGEKIPLEARIVSLVDTYDALTTARVYKKAFTDKEADEIIKANSGKQFDPKIVEIYFEVKDKIIQIKKDLEN